MSYANGRMIRDADSHVMETRDWLTRFLDPGVADRVAPLFGSEVEALDRAIERGKRRKSDPEARAGVDVGCGAILFSAGPAGDRSPGHPLFDPFWRLLNERHVPFMLHIGNGTRTQPKAFQNNGRERAPDIHGGGENLRFCDYIMLWYAPQVFLTA